MLYNVIDNHERGVFKYVSVLYYSRQVDHVNNITGGIPSFNEIPPVNPVRDAIRTRDLPLRRRTKFFLNVS